MVKGDPAQIVGFIRRHEAEGSDRPSPAFIAIGSNSVLTEANLRDLAEDLKIIKGGRKNPSRRIQFLTPEAVQNLDTAQETKPHATDLDSVAERILSTFKDEHDARTDADLLAASGLNREKYLDVRDFLLIETEELSETADTVPTEYIRNWPRKVQAAA